MGKATKAAKSAIYVPSPVLSPDPPSVRVRVPQGAKCKISGFGDLTVGPAEVTLTVTGTVTEIRSVDGQLAWDRGKTLEINPTAIVIDAPGAGDGIDAAVAGARQRV